MAATWEVLTKIGMWDVCFIIDVLSSLYLIIDVKNYIPVDFKFQLIFRKVSDLKKEEELAKRRKNDPALNQSQDHIGFSLLL